MPPAQPAGPHITEPPPPWWAPTHAADAGVRPGPTAFPPGGLGAPVVAGVGEPITPTPAPPPAPPAAEHEMTTVSGDPHPSDPDATRPVGLPPDASAGDASEPAAPPADPDATTTMEPDPGASDHTAEMPRRPEP